MGIKLLNELTWKEVSGLDKEKTFCVIPISSTEQHGLHLPLGTDDFILDFAINCLKHYKFNYDATLLLLPSLKYGKSIEHLKFPGTVTLKLSTLIAVVEDIVESLSLNGFSKFVFLNSHGGNTAALRSIAQDLRFKLNVKVFNVDFWASDFFEPAAKYLQTDFHSEIHAGEIETSLLMYTNPKLVKKSDCLEGDLVNLVKFHGCDYSWLSSDVSQTGILGDATVATPETGEQIAKFMIEKLNNIFDSVINCAFN